MEIAHDPQHPLASIARQHGRTVQSNEFLARMAPAVLDSVVHPSDWNGLTPHARATALEAALAQLCIHVMRQEAAPAAVRIYQAASAALVHTLLRIQQAQA